MNVLKIEKPLIEWEKELDVWMIDLLPEQHYDMYNKIKAFEKIGRSNFRRNWGEYEKKVYNDYLLGGNRKKLCSNVSNNLLDNTKKTFIEWEKEFGYYIFCTNMSTHSTLCTREQAKSLLYSNEFVLRWDENANRIYNSYFNIYNNTLSIIQKPTNTKKTNFLSKFREKCINKIEKKSFITFNNSKIKPRTNNLKRIFAIGLSLITSLNSYSLFNNNTIKYEKDDIDSLINNIDNSLDTNYINNTKITNDDYQQKINKLNDDLINLNNSINDNINLNNSINDNINLNKNSINNEICIGDIVTVKENSHIYNNIYDAIDKNEGENLYYSKDSYRYIKYIALNKDNKIIYSNDNDEIELYKSEGAKTVGVCTSLNNYNLEGYYNYDDVVVKIKIRK